MLPNLIAGYLQMKNNAYYSNLLYIPGYLLFVGYNWFELHSLFQVTYFTILWIMAINGVRLYKANMAKSQPLSEANTRQLDE
jgi:hypothetical protein